MFNIDIFCEKWSTTNTIEEVKKRISEFEWNIMEWAYEKYDFLALGEYKFLEKGKIKTGDRWDENYTYFFTYEFKVPESLVGKNLFLVLDIFGESEVYVNNVPKGSIDSEHSDVRLSSCVKQGEILQIRIQSAKHEHDAVRNERAWGKRYPHHVFNTSKLICKNQDVEAFYYLAKRTLEIHLSYKQDEKVSDQIYEILKTVLYEIDYYETYETFVEEVKKASKRLVEEVKALNIPYCYGKSLWMGHSHLDLAFKWSWKETFRKIERTLSNTCEVLNNHSDGTYVQSQIKILEVLESAYPELFQKTLKLINKGRVEVVGDLYVEFDTNLPSGESLIRQILYGKKFGKAHFMKESLVCYLPDTFGYSGILPQILVQAGYKYFVTAKLDWNDTNQPPYLFFNWHGIDGSKIMSHILASNYGGECDLARVEKYSKDLRQKELTSTRIYQYGAGDGGGGISEDMILNKRALKQLECMVEVADSTLEGAMDDISRSFTNLPSVEGELYFEKHRGVYTSQGNIKKYNRKSELALRDAEIISAVGMLDNITYPQELLDETWKKVLFNQFHDIIAGSSITSVIDEAVFSYKKAIEAAHQVSQHALNKMTTKGEDIILWNTLAWKRDEVVQVTLENSTPLITDMGDNIIYQVIKQDQNLFTVLLDVRDIPSVGYKRLVFNPCKALQLNLPRMLDGSVLENELYKIVFDKVGEMTSIVDKLNNRYVLRGKGNALIAYVDRPGYFESWDIVADFERKSHPIQDVLEMKLIEMGPIRWTMKITKTFRKSIITQFISIYNHNRRIDVKTEMDFYEPQILLKALFEVDIDAPFASYDISIGNLKRPTTNNNSLEKAQFEVNTHKWADLSDQAYGVSILNDCKYGCDIKNNRMRITLLKTSTFPDPIQDIGHHEFTYSILPHLGGYVEGEVTKMAYELNIPSIPVRGETLKESFSFIETKSNNIIVETIKKSEENDDLIIRLYEFTGKSGLGVLQFNQEYETIEKCDVLERVIGKFSLEHGCVSFEIQPYEIVTLKLLKRT